jgi:hypothetical protein
MTKAFDTALFVPPLQPDMGQAPGVGIVGPPFDTEWYYYVIAPGPGVTLGASVPAATDVGQILISGPGPDFKWLTQYELYLGALPAPPSINPAPGAPHVPSPGTMYYNTSDNTPYILNFNSFTGQSNWVPLPVATTNRVTVAASLPAATGMGQMLLSGPQGNPGGTTVYPWTASPGFFLGAHPIPPIQPNIPVGSMYYNTSNNTLYVWSGSAWQTLTTPTKAATASLYYQGTVNQMVYPTTTPDLFGQTYAPTTVEAVEVYLNGVRLTPNGGSIPGDFTFNYATSVLTLATIPPTGSIVTIDVLQDPLGLSPTLILREMLAPITGFDGVETTFDLVANSGTLIVVFDPVDLNVSLDGVLQDPGVDYQLSTNGSQIIFAEPPIADAVCFIVYFSKSATGFLSAVLHDLTMYGDGTAANPLGAVLSSEDALLPGIVYVPPTGIGGTNNAINLAPDGAISVEVDLTTGLVVSPGAPNPLTGRATGSVIAVNLDAGSAHDFTGAGELTLVVATQAQVDAGLDNANPVTSLTLAQSTSLDVRYVNLTGDTMTGPLAIPLPPTTPDELTNKQYVDESIASSMLYQGVWHVAANTPDLTPAVMNPLNGWSWISETVNPDVPEIAPAGLPGIGGLSIDSGDRVLWDAGSAAYDLVKGSSLSITEARSLFVEVAGDQMSGDLRFTGNAQILFPDSSGVQRSSLGPLTLQQGNGGEQPQICDVFGLNGRDIIDTVNGDARYVNVTGDTMTGPLVLNADPTIGPQAATRNYVDTNILALEALKVDRAGDTMTGPLNLPTPPTLATQATSKVYVDQSITTNSLWKGVYLPSLNFPDLNPASMNPQDGWTWFIQTQDPNLPEIIPPGVPGLSGMSVDSGWIIWWNAGASQYNLTRGPDLSMSTALATFVNVTGDTMVGDLNFPNLVGLNLAGAKIVSSGPQLYIQRPIGDNQPQILNFAGNQANNIIDASGSSPMTGNLTFPTDGQGITFSSGGMVYKKVGTGLTLRRHTGNTEVGIENNDGTNRQNILTAATGMGIGTGVLKTGDTMTGTLTINTGNLTVSGVTTLNNSVIVNNASVRTTNNQGMYVDGNSNTSATNGFIVRGSNGSEFCRWWGDAVGYNGPAEARAHCATWNGGWSFQDCWYTVVNSPPTLYANGVVSCQSLTQRSARDDKRDIRDVSSHDVRSAWDALKVRRFRWKDTPIPPDPIGARFEPSPPPPQPDRLGFIADELPEAVVAYAAPGSSDPAKQTRVREGWDVGDMVALCVAKIKELEVEITALKGAR